MLKRTKIFLSILFLSIIFVTPVFAKKSFQDAGTTLDGVAKITGIDTDSSVSTRIGNYVKLGLGLVGLIFFILMVYAGFKWMVSRGNVEKATVAKETIINASIGLVVILLSYAVVAFVTGKIGG